MTKSHYARKDTIKIYRKILNAAARIERENLLNGYIERILDGLMAESDEVDDKYCYECIHSMDEYIRFAQLLFRDVNTNQCELAIKAITTVSKLFNFGGKNERRPLASRDVQRDQYG